MEGDSKQGQDRISSPSTSAKPSLMGRKPAETNLKEQSVPPKVEWNPSANRSSAPKIGPLKDQTSQLESSTIGTFTNVYPLEQTYYYGGYENNTINWNDYNYVGANGFPVVPLAMFNENPSTLFHSGYGLDSQIAYGQFSPMSNPPMYPIMVDGQLFSPHQVSPVSLPYYLPSVSPALPRVNSSLPVSQPELMTIGNSGQEIHGESMLFGPAYFVHDGALGGGVGLPGEPLSTRSSTSDSTCYIPSLTSPGAVYTQPFGILGPYDHTFGQFPQEQRIFHGLGSVENSSTRKYPSDGSYRNVAPNNKQGGRFTPDKGGKQERNRETTYVPAADAHGMSVERNRGPRASNNLKGKNASEESGNSTTGIGKNIESISDMGCDSYNLGDFTSEYKNAKFFIIKSFSEDNVHKSIKYSVWSSTPLGNRKLDAAYHESKEQKDPCPVFLLFSVNSSGQFCGVAEMVGPVDFENNAEYWQQDRWSGQFPVKWHILKDVPNGRFRHIILENNENKPVTHSRDSQEVKLEQGIEILKILKDYNSKASILDDFSFYNEREKMLLGRKAKQQQSSSKIESTILLDSYISQLPYKFSESVHLDDSSKSKLK